MTFAYFNLLGVLIAAVASIILGMVWYGPLFGKLWMKLSGIKMTDKQIQEAKKKGMTAQMIAAFLGNVVMAVAISVLFSALGVSSLGAAWALAVVLWVGFILTTTMSGVLWEGKSLSLYSLNNLYTLVHILMVSAIVYYC
ncbi:MAG: DUF1761 domain-containing protein [Nanoarchaeota archaeon]